jgi:hypothetical protein
MLSKQVGKPRRSFAEGLKERVAEQGLVSKAVIISAKEVRSSHSSEEVG